jgi:hypothetical protein
VFGGFPNLCEKIFFLIQCPEAILLCRSGRDFRSARADVALVLAGAAAGRFFIGPVIKIACGALIRGVSCTILTTAACATLLVPRNEGTTSNTQRVHPSAFSRTKLLLVAKVIYYCYVHPLSRFSVLLGILISDYNTD